MGEQGGHGPQRAAPARLPLALAERIADAVLAAARERRSAPVTVTVLDDGGHVKTTKREDGCPFLVAKVAHGKAYATVALGWPSRAVAQFGTVVPNLIPALAAISDGQVTPAPGGVLVRDASGAVLGSVGVSGGDAADDERLAIDAVRAAGLVPEPDA